MSQSRAGSTVFRLTGTGPSLSPWHPTMPHWAAGSPIHSVSLHPSHLGHSFFLRLAKVSPSSEKRDQLQAHLPCPYLFLSIFQPRQSCPPGLWVLSSHTAIAGASCLMIPLKGTASAFQQGPPVLNEHVTGPV